MRYFCEFPGCGIDYKTRKGADNCALQGIIGSAINPGFTLGKSGNGYLIVTSTRTDKGHEREYKLIDIMDSMATIRLNEKSARSGSEPSSRYQNSFGWNNYKISRLERSLESGNTRLLEQDEFRKISRLIHNGKSFNALRTALQSEGIERLFRTHSYFSH